MLALKNPHERDNQITFQEDGHIYLISGIASKKPSVTSVAHKFFHPFDADEIIKKMMKKKERTDKWVNMTPDEIKEAWKKNGEEAAALGTKMHAQIEDFLNGIPFTEITPEINQFIDFWTQFQKNCPNLKPYRTEWLIWDDQT